MLDQLPYWILVDVLERGHVVGNRATAACRAGITTAVLYATSRALRDAFDARDGYLIRQVPFPDMPLEIRFGHQIAAVWASLPPEQAKEDDGASRNRDAIRRGRVAIVRAWMHFARVAAQRHRLANAALVLAACPGGTAYGLWCERCQRERHPVRRFWAFRAALLGSRGAWAGLQKHTLELYEPGAYENECGRRAAVLGHADASSRHAFHMKELMRFSVIAAQMCGEQPETLPTFAAAGRTCHEQVAHLFLRAAALHHGDVYVWNAEMDAWQRDAMPLGRTGAMAARSYMYLRDPRGSIINQMFECLRYATCAFHDAHMREHAAAVEWLRTYLRTAPLGEVWSRLAVASDPLDVVAARRDVCTWFHRVATRSPHSDRIHPDDAHVAYLVRRDVDCAGHVCIAKAMLKRPSRTPTAPTAPEGGGISDVRPFLPANDVFVPLPQDRARPAPPLDEWLAQVDKNVCRRDPNACATLWPRIAFCDASDGSAPSPPTMNAVT